ncbi:hypothetical protein BJX61DRAFT_501538 [Aspergillus egyptiacus]|nr:hypothetical protein BJX61DRAFT_501538 [Aspergillus egyptiacus]
MADTTTHDTVGMSTLAGPYFSPSSPSPSEHPPADTPDRLPSPVSSPGARSPSHSPPSGRELSIDRAARELDARLAQYTVDFSQFPSGDGPDDALDDLPEQHDETDRLSAVGGPEDFTANLERYLLGEEDSIDQESSDQNEDPEQPKRALEPERKPQDKEHKIERQHHDRFQQPAAEDETELNEYSEFGPPDDMSTPSHLLRRMTAHTRTQLADIEEDPDDEPSLAATPSVRKPKSPINKDDKSANEDLRRQIAELTQAVKDRDEELEKSRKHVLEAASAGEETDHLRAELQRIAALLEQLQGTSARKGGRRRSSASGPDFSSVQKQITDMQKLLQNRNLDADIDTERLETIAILRQQLSLTQEQLRKRDATLEETLAKLKEVTASKELQLREKNSEIDELRSEIDNQRLDLQKLETELASARREYRFLEDQMAELETKNRPLEEKNSTLEADLTRAQSQVTAQENALKAMAADRPAENVGGTYSEILELIKDLGQPDASRAAKPRDEGDSEFEQIRDELARLRTESDEAVSANKSLEAQLSRAHDHAAESQLLIQSIEAENTRLTEHAEDLKAALNKAQDELNSLRIEHAEAFETIERLQDEQLHDQQRREQTQQPSPPPTPHSTLEATHKAQIASLKSAHATAISSLRTAHADSARKLRALLSASEKREEDLRAELTKYTSKPESDQERENEISSLRAEIKRLQAAIAAKNETASAMDLRIAKSVEKREREWERRVELLLKERERMSKALLWSWGEKELPHDDKEYRDEDGKRRQAYRYKYAKRA